MSEDDRVDPFLLPAPASATGSFRYVFEHLATTIAAEPSSYDALSPDQHIVLALGTLRRDVSADGFGGYLGNVGRDRALDAQAAASLIGHAWQVLISAAVDRDPSDDFRDLDSVFADLEDDQSVDAVLDEYVWATRDAFFG
ncbi:DMP19 family protein [Nocardioides marmoriginsengisoli]|nr:hypothetical protein [Nocardioides marmoriginsengisoli]